jgi:hypothetical protein
MKSMNATRNRRTRSSAGRLARRRKPVARGAKPAKPASRLNAAPLQVMYRFCKPGWAVSVETAPSSQGTRFVCPFCAVSHRVSGAVRGFRKMRRAQWNRLRRVEE